MALSTRKTIITHASDEIEAEVAALEKTRKAQTLLRMFENVAAAGVFASIARRGFGALSSGPLRWVFMPAIFLASALDFLASLKKAYHENKIQGGTTTLTKMDVAVNALVAGGSIAAGVLTFLSYAVASPILVAAVGLKALFDFGSAAYHFVHSLKEAKNDIEKAERHASRQSAISSLLSGIVNSIITVSLALIAFTPGVNMIIPLALGLAATVVGVGAHAYMHRDNEKTDVVHTEVDAATSLVTEEPSGTTARIQHGLGIADRVVYGLNIESAPQVTSARTVEYGKGTQRVHLNTPSTATTHYDTSVTRHDSEIPDDSAYNSSYTRRV